jgi:hypothetical protein
MNINDAIPIALSIQREHPSYYLCGGLALVLTGRIPPRDVHDLDFTALLTPADLSHYRKCTYFRTDKLEQETYKGSHPHEHCLFVNPEMTPGSTIAGLRCADLEQTIQWKRCMNREKDLIDLRWEDGHSLYLIKNDKLLLKV